MTLVTDHVAQESLRMLQRRVGQSLFVFALVALALPSFSARLNARARASDLYAWMVLGERLRYFDRFEPAFREDGVSDDGTLRFTVRLSYPTIVDLVVCGTEEPLDAYGRTSLRCDNLGGAGPPDEPVESMTRDGGCIAAEEVRRYRLDDCSNSGFPFASYTVLSRSCGPFTPREALPIPRSVYDTNWSDEDYSHDLLHFEGETELDPPETGARKLAEHRAWMAPLICEELWNDAAWLSRPAKSDEIERELRDRYGWVGNSLNVAEQNPAMWRFIADNVAPNLTYSGIQILLPMAVLTFGPITGWLAFTSIGPLVLLSRYLHQGLRRRSPATPEAPWLPTIAASARKWSAYNVTVLILYGLLALIPLAVWGLQGWIAFEHFSVLEQRIWIMTLLPCALASGVDAWMTILLHRFRVAVRQADEDNDEWN